MARKKPTPAQQTTPEPEEPKECSPKSVQFLQSTSPKTLINSKQAPKEIAGAIVDRETGEQLEYCHLKKHPKYQETWKISYGHEIRWLAQRMQGRVKGTNTMFFIREKEIPTNKICSITYGRLVCDYQEGKVEPNRTRFTMGGGDKIHYLRDCGTPKADLLTIKILLDSIISTPRAKFVTMDIKSFYLNTPLKRYEYLQLKMSDIPEDVQHQYNLQTKVTSEG